MNIETMSFKKKIIANFLFLIFLFGLILIYLLNSQNKLGALQDAGAGRFKDAELISHILLEVSEVYAVVADAEINHNLNESKKDLAEIKKKMLVNIATIEKMAETNDEKKWALDFKTNYIKYVGTFDNEMMPELEKSETINPFEKPLIPLNNSPPRRL